MTLRAVAKKICQAFREKAKENKGCACDVIESALREVEEEANQELKDKFKHWTDTAHNAAIEEAAKVAENSGGAVGVWHEIAKRIRALKREGK